MERWLELLMIDFDFTRCIWQVDAKTADAQPVEQVKSQPSGAAGAETAAV